MRIRNVVLAALLLAIAFLAQPSANAEPPCYQCSNLSCRTASFGHESCYGDQSGCIAFGICP